jgi:hypothetical protein
MKTRSGKQLPKSRAIKALKECNSRPAAKKVKMAVEDGIDDIAKEADKTDTCAIGENNSKILEKHHQTTPSKVVSVIQLMATSAELKKTPLKTPLAKILTDAKRAFQRCSTPSRLVGREPERKVIGDFLSTCLGNQDAEAVKGSSLYISGCPGTGKTALVNEVITALQVKNAHIKVAFINCMAANTKVIYSKTMEAFGLDSDSSNQEDRLAKFFQKPIASKNDNDLMCVCDYNE